MQIFLGIILCGFLAYFIGKGALEKFAEGDTHAGWVLMAWAVWFGLGALVGMEKFNNESKAKVKPKVGDIFVVTKASGGINWLVVFWFLLGLFLIIGTFAGWFSK